MHGDTNTSYPSNQDENPENEDDSSLSISRMTKKRTSPDSSIEYRPSQVSRRIVPKLGPTFSIKLRDIQHLRNAAHAVLSENASTVHAALNFLMGWSAIVKDISYKDEISQVMSCLFDFLINVLDTEVENSHHQFERSQYTSMESDVGMQCMSAGMILKNLIMCSEKKFEDTTLNSKLAKLLSIVVKDTHDMAYTLMRDLLMLCRKITSLQDYEETIAHGLVTLMVTPSFPLRLRATALDALSELIEQDTIRDVIVDELKSQSIEFKLNLSIFLMLPMDMALNEAESEINGALDYEGLALLIDETTPADQREEELKLWAWRLQSEALRSASNFLRLIAKYNCAQFISADKTILQVLVNLTTRKKLNDLVSEHKGFLDSKHVVIVDVRRNMQASEILAYKTILDILQEGPAELKKKLKDFETHFVLGAFENTWQAKQCSMILSFMSES